MRGQSRLTRNLILFVSIACLISSAALAQEPAPEQQAQENVQPVDPIKHQEAAAPRAPETNQNASDSTPSAASPIPERKLDGEKAGQTVNLTDGEEEIESMFNLYDIDLENEWNTYLSGYDPESYTRFKIDGKKEEVFIEMVDEPCQIRGLVYAANYPIEFYITGQQGDQLFFKNNKTMIIFALNVTKIGQYFFHISNKNSSKSQIIHFSVDVSILGEKVLEEDLNPIEFEITQLSAQVGEYMYQTQFSHKRYEHFNYKIKSTKWKLLFLTMFETIIILGATVWQIYYIKKIVDYRSII